MSKLLILVECAAGYALFETHSNEQIGQNTDQVQSGILDITKFKKLVSLLSFIPFKSAAHALENQMDVSEGILNDHLKGFLEMNVPKKSVIGLGESNLGGSIKAALSIDCKVDENVRELIRGIRYHSEKLIPVLKAGDLGRAQLGLGHAYSRSKVKFNVNRVDNMITQSIALLDQLDKDVNTFAMRVREWYGWHFPELIKIVADHQLYAKLVQFIKHKSSLGEESLEGLEALVEDPLKAKQIVDAARASMGTELSEVDMANIQSFTTRIISLSTYRKSLHTYLVSKMHAVAPNLSALLGEVIGARIIAHAGSLTNLAKYPASTIQILGAEKALFRALKTKGNTPKYGLIYHSTFIGRAAQKNKGRISRILANKIAIASRIDCFLDIPTAKFGELLREQVEERLRFYEEGIKPRKNSEAMATALKAVGLEDLDLGEDEEMTEAPKKQKKRSADDEESPKKKSKKSKAVEEPMQVDEPQVEVKAKKAKKEKKEKTVEPEVESVQEVKKDKKKKSKKE